MNADWWDDISNMAAFFGDSPALAVDFAINGAPPDVMGYHLAYGIQSSPTELPVYPEEV